jgi:hypothetical protein
MSTHVSEYCLQTPGGYGPIVLAIFHSTNSSVFKCPAKVASKLGGKLP